MKKYFLIIAVCIAYTHINKAALSTTQDRSLDAAIMEEVNNELESSSKKRDAKFWQKIEPAFQKKIHKCLKEVSDRGISKEDTKKTSQLLAKAYCQILNKTTSYVDSFSEPPLLSAAMFNNHPEQANLIAFLARYGASIHWHADVSKNPNQLRPLAAANNAAAIQALINIGAHAQSYATNNPQSSVTVLQYHLTHRPIDQRAAIIDVLLAEGASVIMPTELFAELNDSAERGMPCLRIFYKLLQHGGWQIFPSMKTSIKTSLIKRALQQQSHSFAIALVNKDVSLKELRQERASVFAPSILNANAESVRLLIEAGAPIYAGDPNNLGDIALANHILQTAEGETAGSLHRIVQLLIDRDAAIKHEATERDNARRQENARILAEREEAARLRTEHEARLRQAVQRYLRNPDMPFDSHNWPLTNVHNHYQWTRRISQCSNSLERVLKNNAVRLPELTLQKLLTLLRTFSNPENELPIFYEEIRAYTEEQIAIIESNNLPCHEKLRRFLVFAAPYVGRGYDGLLYGIGTAMSTGLRIAYFALEAASAHTPWLHHAEDSDSDEDIGENAPQSPPPPYQPRAPQGQPPAYPGENQIAAATEGPDDSSDS